MRYAALACDYDETLATFGQVSASTLDALRRLRSSGRRLVLVTGRRIEDLQEVFPQYAICDRIVAENGALLYAPESGGVRLLADAPPARFVHALRARGVEPLESGRVIVGTREPHEKRVIETIRDLGLELHVVFNKGAVMVLPSGTNKGTGLSAALRDLGLGAERCVAIGDAENDHALLASAAIGVAVDNALPALKERAQLVMRAQAGDGVRELVDRLLGDDLAAVRPARSSPSS